MIDKLDIKIDKFSLGVVLVILIKKKITLLKFWPLTQHLGAEGAQMLDSMPT